MTLDTTIPYGEVWGIPGVRFEQGGRLFSLQGIELQCLDETNEIYGPAEVTAEPVGAPSEVSGQSSGDFRSMHWKRLKALVESYGGDFTTKEAAIAYLEGRI